MRFLAVLMCAALAACTSGAVTVPDANVTEVPMVGSASSYGDANLSGDPISVGPVPGPVGFGVPSPHGTGSALDQDRINLMQWTLEQQKIDAAKAESDLEAARRQLVIYKPTNVPSDGGVNVALYAKQTTNAVGQRIYDRSVGARISSMGACGRYRTDDDAQRAFLSSGGPDRDPLGLDPDGDGFACNWNPDTYRALN
jgi:hypothetical protein